MNQTLCTIANEMVDVAEDEIEKPSNGCENYYTRKVPHTSNRVVNLVARK